MVYAVGTSLSGLSYTVTSSDVAPTAQQLGKAAVPPAAIADEYLGVPAPFRSLKALAEKVTKGAATPYGKAIALQQWFTLTGGFSYSLNAAEPASAAALARFLTVTKRGYCQQFAFAMAVLARLLGIPSRIAVGFTAGTSAGNDTWVVKSSDAHAWPELYFQGAGWLRFEPTPAGMTGQGTASPPVYSVPVVSEPTGSPVPSMPLGAAGTGSGTNRSSAVAGPHAHPVPGEETGPGAAGSGGGFPVFPLAVAVGLLAALLATPWAGRSVTRRRRRMLAGKPPSGGHGRAVAVAGAGMGKAADDAARAHAAWREVLDDFADYRVGTYPSESPRAVARRVTDELNFSPPTAEALRRIALAEERASYSGNPSPAATLRPDMDLVRRGIAASAGRWARWRARIFPASVRAPLRARAAHAAEAISAATVWHGRRGRAAAKANAAGTVPY
jgi:hypothetical protein